MNTETTPAPKEVPQPASGDGVEIDRDDDGELLIDWSPRKGRMLALSLRKDGRLSYAFAWDDEKAHGTVQMPSSAASGAPQEAPGDAPSEAAKAVLAERARQTAVECWTPEHDDEHDDGSLSMAAACYALPEPTMEAFPNGESSPEWWPWAARDWKPKDRRTNLVRAGALILAEIERIDRAAMKGPQ